MYHRILVAVDGSPTSNLALLEASRVAAPDAAVRVVSVVEDPAWSAALEPGAAYDTDLLHVSLVKAGKDILERARNLLKHKGIDARTHLVDLNESPGSSIPAAIMREAESWPADVVVIGTHGRRGFNRLLMGSVAENVLRSATRPVLLVRGVPGSDAVAEATREARAAHAEESGDDDARE